MKSASHGYATIVLLSLLLLLSTLLTQLFFDVETKSLSLQHQMQADSDQARLLKQARQIQLQQESCVKNCKKRLLENTLEFCISGKTSQLYEYRLSGLHETLIVYLAEPGATPCPINGSNITAFQGAYWENQPEPSNLPHQERRLN